MQSERPEPRWWHYRPEPVGDSVLRRPVPLGRAILIALVIVLLMPVAVGVMVILMFPILGDREYGVLVVENACATDLQIHVNENAPVTEGHSEPFLLPVGEELSTGSLRREGSFNILALGPTGEQYREHGGFDEESPEVRIRISGPDCPA